MAIARARSGQSSYAIANSVDQAELQVLHLHFGEKATMQQFSFGSINPGEQCGSLRQWSPIFLAPGTSFSQDSFSTDVGAGKVLG